MTDDPLDYARLVDRAMQSVMREALQIATEQGLPGRHHFYLTLDTTHPDVEIGDSLRAQYPEEITIVLEHQFWDLTVEEDRFSVALSFGGQPQTLNVPFDAVTAFVDPSVKFGLQFSAAGETDDAVIAVPAAEEPETAAKDEPETETAPPEPKKDQSGPAEVVTLDSFRKKD